MPSKNLRFFIYLKRVLHKTRVGIQFGNSLAQKAVAWLIPLLCIIAGGIVIYDVGFRPFYDNSFTLATTLRVVILLLVFLLSFRFVGQFFQMKSWKSKLFHLFLILFLSYLYQDAAIENQIGHGERSNRFLIHKIIYYSGILFLLVTECAHLFAITKKKKFNASLLFVLSFLMIIFIGTGLLLLPKATHHGITITDALFTATSAVCVTGLTVLDTATQFTRFGQVIILMLLQIGGVGIMTFAALLGYAISGGASFQSQLAMKDMMSSDKIGNVILLVGRIILVMLVFEAIGAVGIYFSVDDGLFARKLDKIFFAVFHSISSFCNAGFSTFSQGVYELPFRFNYSMHLILAMLVVLGGMGFPIVFNIIKFFGAKLSNIFASLAGNKRKKYIPKLMSINTRLALVTTSILLVAGAFFYFIFEQHATLAEHQTLGGKIVTSIFASVVPRSGGLTTVDMSLLTMPTIMIYLLLMWIGASPGSTGGGVKTTTFAVAVLNLMSVIRGKQRTEFYRTEISKTAINRAFAIILLSFLFIGASTFLLAINDSRFGMTRLVFEAFSAYSTVGLSLGLTHQLSEISKLVLVVTMFIGRVGALTLLMGVVKQQKQLHYRYPTESVTF